jgi:hypothetical protein
MRALLNSKLSFLQIFVLLAIFVYSWELEGYFRYKLPFGSFRLYQFVFAVPIAVYLVDKLLKFKFAVPRFSLSIIFWGIFMVLFIPNSLHLGNAVNYAFYIWFDIFAMLAIIAFFKTEKQIQILITVYIVQAVFQSILVIGQFILFHLGIDTSVQNSFLGILPRVSGFTTEPSHFSDYTLVCFFVITILKEYCSSFFSHRFLNYSFWLVFVALIISTSRFGITIALAWVVFRNFIRKENPVRKIVKIMLCLIMLVFTYITFEEEISIIFDGMNMVAALEENRHASAGVRSDVALKMLQTFLDNPIVGTSLGGVDPYLARLHGNPYYTPEHNGRACGDYGEWGGDCGGGSAFAEVLAASGIVAFPFFLVFWIDLLKKPITAIRNLSWQHSIVIKALLWGLVLLFLKHIVSPGTHSIHNWVHYGILMASFFVYRKGTMQRNLSEELK